MLNRLAIVSARCKLSSQINQRLQFSQKLWSLKGRTLPIGHSILAAIANIGGEDGESKSIYMSSIESHGDSLSIGAVDECISKIGSTNAVQESGRQCSKGGLRCLSVTGRRAIYGTIGCGTNNIGGTAHNNRDSFIFKLSENPIASRVGARRGTCMSIIVKRKRVRKRDRKNKPVCGVKKKDKIKCQKNKKHKMKKFNKNVKKCAVKTRKCKRPKQKKKKHNYAAVLKKVNKLKIEPRPIPSIRNGEVLVAMDCVGICGSDVHYYSHGRIGQFIMKKPMIIGHEGSGIIEKVGSGVKSLKRGDRVALEPGYPCYKCVYCKSGRYNLCPKMIFCATPPYDGNLVTYFKHKADFCFKLPKHASMEEGALMEPLSVGVAACRRANLSLGSEVLILGAGPIGLCAVIAAKRAGVSKITIIDMSQYRLKVAKKLGAKTICICPEKKAKHIIKEVKKKIGSLPNKTIDCAGTPKTIALGMQITRPGGTLALVGMLADKTPLPIMAALSREVDIVGIFRYCNDYPVALSMLKSGKLGIKSLVTHHFNFCETSKAFETARRAKEGTIKVMIHLQPRDRNNKKPFKN